MPELFALADAPADCAWPENPVGLRTPSSRRCRNLLCGKSKSRTSCRDSRQFRVSGKSRNVESTTGTIRDLTDWQTDGVRHVFLFPLPRKRSYFIVFAKDAVPSPAKRRISPKANFWRAWLVLDSDIPYRRNPSRSQRTGSLRVPYRLGRDESDDIRYFSGNAVYEMTFDLPAYPQKDKWSFNLVRLPKWQKCV